MMREAAARDDHRAGADADHDFHHAIVTASGNHMT
jgi:DNA-binding GntR family transcriptional regulator